MNIKLINSKVNMVLKGLSPIVLPIPVEEVAKIRGVKVVPYPMEEDVSGVLAIQNGEGTIGFNQAEPRARRRFTIAHELGHFELHREKSDVFVDKQFIYRSKMSGDSLEKQQMEQEANYFASALLMPSDLVRQEVDNIELDLANEEAIEKLAKIFDVSTTAMSVRMSQLGFL